jgi:iron complex outermembrane receptor protein
LNASANYFYRRINDFIDWVKDSISQPWQPQNFQTINTSGITFSADYRWRNDDIHKSNFALITSISYTYISAYVINTINSKADKISAYMLNNLRSHLCINTNFELFHTFNFTIAARYEQRINYKDYTLIDTHLSFGGEKNYSVYLDANNIFNIQYIEAGAAPMPGRWITLGVKWKLGIR